MPKIDKNLPSKLKKVKKKTVKSAQVKTSTKSALAKPRSLIRKENTLAYYNCLLEQVANNDKVKITKLCN
jgi:hypothetical protein